MEINHNHVIVKKSHDYGWFPFALSSFVPQLEPQPQPLTTTTTTATTKATTTTTITTIDNKSPWVFFLFLYALLIFFFFSYENHHLNHLNDHTLLSLPMPPTSNQPPTDSASKRWQQQQQLRSRLKPLVCFLYCRYIFSHYTYLFMWATAAHGMNESLSW